MTTTNTARFGLWLTLLLGGSLAAVSAQRRGCSDGSVEAGRTKVRHLRGVPRRRRQQRDPRLADARGPARELHRAPAAGLQERRAHRRDDEAVRRPAVGAGHARRRGLLRGADPDAERRRPDARGARPADLPRRRAGARRRGLHRLPRARGQRQPARRLSARQRPACRLRHEAIERLRGPATGAPTSISIR